MREAKRNARAAGYRGKLEPGSGKHKLRYTHTDGTVVQFGHVDYDDWTVLKSKGESGRRANYCARSSGIKTKPLSANALARAILWAC